jgi:alpha-beta hydrolase superfamily lysophospholipase
MLAQRIAQTHSSDLAGVFLLGTGMSGAGYDGLVIAMREVETLGRDAPSEVSRMVFQVLCNRPFQPVATPFDWLSSDAAAVSEYAADPMCGIPISCGLHTDYQTATALLMTPQGYEAIPPSLPFLILNGTEDTSAPLEAVIALIQKLAALGMRDVTWRLYPGARHDLLHETHRAEVEQDISAWLALHRPPAARD